MEVMEGDQVEKERWKMPEEEDQEECWGFEDLEYESDGSSSSPHDSISTESSWSLRFKSLMQI
jgi:hypothetical protein